MVFLLLLLLLLLLFFFFLFFSLSLFFVTLKVYFVEVEEGGRGEEDGEVAACTQGDVLQTRVLKWCLVKGIERSSSSRSRSRRRIT